MFAVLQLNQKVKVDVLGRGIELDLSYANGMIGAIPVFENREDAEAFAGDKYKISEITTKNIRKRIDTHANIPNNNRNR